MVFCVQQDLTIFRHSQYQDGVVGGALLGPASTTWQWPGTALSASVKHLMCNWLDPARLVDGATRWLIVWNPLTLSPNKAGIRLVGFYANLATPTVLATLESTGLNPSPAAVNSGDIVGPGATTFAQAIRTWMKQGSTEGHEMYIGHQMHGDGVNGARLFTSEVQLVWQNS